MVCEARRCGRGPHIDNPSIARWFDTAAFKLPETHAFGNSGRNILFGPGQVKVDRSMHKEAKIAEKYTLQFRAEAFNMPNHPNFANPSNSVNTPSSFGKITRTTLEPRIVQFGLKPLF